MRPSYHLNDEMVGLSNSILPCGKALGSIDIFNTKFN